MHDGSDRVTTERVAVVPGRAGHRLPTGVVVAGTMVGLGLLALVGWVAWNQGALVGLRWVEFDAPLTLAALGFIAGIGAFFAPCAFALFPAYVSYYLAAVGGGRESPGRSLALGLSCAAGSALFFALTGIAITLLGGAISPYLVATKPAIALGVALLGVVLVAEVRVPSLALPLGSARRWSPGGAIFAYGFAYALASTGCTLPIYVSIIVLPLTSGYSGAALLTFGSFALAMALMMLLTSLLVGLAKTSLLERLQASTVWVKRVSGVVLIAVGLYLGYYYLVAGM